MNKKLKAVIMATTKNGKVPAKVEKDDPKAVDALKDKGLAEQKTNGKGKPETVLTDAGKKAKAKAEKDDRPTYKPEGRADKKAPKAPKKSEPQKADKKAEPKKPEKASKKADKTDQKTKVRKNTKQHQIIKMLSRQSGATIQQLHEATGWKLTTLRGTPGALKLKLGIEIESEKRDGKDTVYRITGGLDSLEFV